MSDDEFEHIINPLYYVPENIKLVIERLTNVKTINERSSSNPAPKDFNYLKHIVVIGHCSVNEDSNNAVKDAFERLNKECGGDNSNLYAFDVKTNMQITFQGYHIILSASIYHPVC